MYVYVYIYIYIYIGHHIYIYIYIHIGRHYLSDATCLVRSHGPAAPSNARFSLLILFLLGLLDPNFPGDSLCA